MLHVYSKKLQRILDFEAESGGKLIPIGAAPISGTNILFAWNNSVGGWIDQGWNNSVEGWTDQGWNNSVSNWQDQGWNNSASNWQDQGWSNSADSWGDSGGSGGGCFITTACVEQRGLSDDCHEMQVLRQYRDILVENDEEFRNMILEYYRKAPLIIQAIETRNDSAEVYDALYNNMIKPCVNMLEEGKTEEAKELYLEYYERLSEQYLAS